MAGEVVAWFEIRTEGEETYNTHASIEICGNEQFYLGRDTELCRYSWSDDLTISRKHLRVHCILYEQDPVAQIAPFVYATNLSANGTYLKKSNSECTASQGGGIFMGQNSTFLLDAGDEIRISDTVTLIYRSIKAIEEVKLNAIQERERNVFASRYLVTGRLLGEGGYGKVLVGIHQETQRQLACKMIRLDHMYGKLPVPNLRLPSEKREAGTCGGRKRWPTKVANCFREFDILKDLSHPNIVAIEKVFWSHNTIYIFQELVTGGDLFSFLEFKGGRLSNIQAAVVIQQVLKGVEYLHNQDIVHRDLKPDNILMTSLEDGARVVITDFGNARFLPGKENASSLENNKYQRMFSYVGTLEFAAPEIHRANRAIPASKGYSKCVDMWSIGSVTATILTGDVIFTDRNHPDYLKDPRGVIIGLAAICDLSILDETCHPLWGAVGDRAKSFIKGLLVLEEEGRMTASEALAHPWFTNDCHADDFGDLYKRSIQDWKPRQKILQLTERISKFTPSCNSTDDTDQFVGHATASPFFPPPPQLSPTLNILPKLLASQRWRVHTHLPSIRDDYEQGQFASQLKSLTNEERNLDDDNLQVYLSDRDNQFDRQQSCVVNHDTYNSQPDNVTNSCMARRLRRWEDSIRGQVSPSKISRPDMENSNETTENEDNIGPQESLNRVMDACSQQGYCIGARQPQRSDEAEESELVGETPFSEHFDMGKSSDNGQQTDNSPHQTQFPVENPQYTPLEGDQDSVLVLETPPLVFRKDTLSSGNDLPTYEDWYDNESTANQPDAEHLADCLPKPNGKRRRLLHDDI